MKNVIDEGCADKGIPVPNVTGKTLAKVIEYCKKHADEGVSARDRSSWDADFIRVDQATLFDILLVRFLFFISIIRDYRFLGLKVVIFMVFQAANYLSIKDLLDLTCQTVADLIKGRTPEEIRKIFNIKNDFTPEEEENIRRENQWAFE